MFDASGERITAMIGGTEVGSLVLEGSKNVDQFWIQSNTLIGPDLESNEAGIWNYPDGGNEVGA